MLEEFREFALKGNVVDLAVGLIIGAAFTAIVSALVDDILMPPLGVLLGGVDFSNYFLQLTGRDHLVASLPAASEMGVAVLAYGKFINAVIKFVIVAFALFLVVRQMNRLHRLLAHEQSTRSEATPAPPDILLLTEIRDLLKERR